jgi:hypothetical protein
MSVPAKLAAFAVVLVLSFGAAYAVGAAVGPIEDTPSDGGHTPTTTTAPTTAAPTTAAPLGGGHDGEHGG